MKNLDKIDALNEISKSIDRLTNHLCFNAPGGSGEFPGCLEKIAIEMSDIRLLLNEILNIIRNRI